MTKPSDLFKKTGTGGAGGAKVNPFAPIPGMPGDKATEKSADKLAADERHAGMKKPARGHDMNEKAARAKGGGGGSSARPKV
jgi:hypothetical protein